ncbi:hypothetical protein [Undibacterium sp. RuRC25W]|uniref:hypothetical protein n=1 Tax=Undibacterium sp. RuRC25W TaxID=3413047 RepID=UPI003BF3C30F
MNKLKTLLVSSMVGLVVAGCGGTSSAPISGTLKGLSTGTTLQLLNNGVNPIVLSANGVFTFSISISAGSTYNVTIGTQPIGETCTVTNGTGTVNSSGSGVTNVAVNCVASTNSNNIVLGQLSGLPAGDFVTLLNGADTLTLNVNGMFAFPTAVSTGNQYNVTLQSQTAGLNCTLANTSGTIPVSGPITAVVVSCH